MTAVYAGCDVQSSRWHRAKLGKLKGGRQGNATSADQAIFNSKTCCPLCSSPTATSDWRNAPARREPDPKHLVSKAKVPMTLEAEVGADISRGRAIGGASRIKPPGGVWGTTYIDWASLE